LYARNWLANHCRQISEFAGTIDMALALTGAMLSIIPTAAAEEPATVTTVCTQFGTALLPPGPPQRVAS
jgi:hypothetical protein